jgi:transcriptional regulator with XRE-family HTH domain
MTKGDPNMNYKNRISALRKSHHLTQDDMSTTLGISRAALSHYEKGRREPDYDTLIKIADFFKVSLDYIMGRTDDPLISLDPEIREFTDQLELSDDQLLHQFDLTIDGTKLSVEEAKRFIAFVRAERAMN